MQPARRNQMAVASLVVAIVSWFCFGLLGSIVAIILGLTARERIRESNAGGARLATVAIWMSYFHIVVSVVLLIGAVVYGLHVGLGWFGGRA